MKITSGGGAAILKPRLPTLGEVKTPWVDDNESGFVSQLRPAGELTSGGPAIEQIHGD